MKHITNTLNYDYKAHPGEVNNEPSVTIPEQTMSLKEILARHARGLPTTGREPIYHGDEDYLPDFKKMDLAEIQEYKEQLREHTEKVQAQYDTEQKELTAKRAKAAADQQSLWNQFRAAMHAKNNQPDEQPEPKPRRS